MPSLTTLEFTCDHGVAHITLNRPDAANGLDMTMAQELLQVSIACRADPEVRAVLLDAHGRMFCAGGDLKSFVAHQAQLHAYIKELTTYLHAAITNFARMRAPLIAAVQGAAAGAGFSIVCCADLVLAARSAKFTMAYTGAGLVPDGSSSYFLPRIVGLRRTQELMLTNRRLGAEEALDWGIVTRVVDDEALTAEAGDLAQQIAAGPTGAFAAVKKLLAGTFECSLETQMEQESMAIADAAISADGLEGVAAFFARRPAVFSGH
ncbi:MAG: enoyl-CoA hydratase/isomerase family protein [Pseudomonadales bacterium]|nr:enoyl-CoA hydratase/isomerase family protein [Pseudomonadales bacterium]